MKKVLHVGLEAPKRDDAFVTHLPLIEIVPKVGPDLLRMQEATHIIVTSKTTVSLIKEHLIQTGAQFISVGSATTESLMSLGIKNVLTTPNECQEGAIELIDSLTFDDPFFFWPRSSLARPLLERYFEEKGFRYIACEVYNTLFKAPDRDISLQEFDEIHFTSPSTVDAFFHFFGRPPEGIDLKTKGHVTQSRLLTNLNKR